jgi:hypothetical protein
MHPRNHSSSPSAIVLEGQGRADAQPPLRCRLDEAGDRRDCEGNDGLMDRIARSPREDRAELFRRSAAVLRPERSPGIIEKDFWACWTLHRIYRIPTLGPHLIFKGGTSLSKGYGAIQRFSEDVDLSISRRHLGFVDGRDPEEPRISKNECRRRIDALVAKGQGMIRDQLLPQFLEDFRLVLGGTGWGIELDVDDPQTLIFSYPRSEVAAHLPRAIRPVIRLEMGARSDDWPAEEREIRPYAAEAFPETFSETGSVHVHVLDARRTFWEKATILHAEYHRRTGEIVPPGRSRHYYDVCQLFRRGIGREALDRMDLLERVVAHKRLFFASGWAGYDTAVPGSFHLVPGGERIDALRTDYAQMQEMIFGDAPPWDQVLDDLRKIEALINAGKRG